MATTHSLRIVSRHSFSILRGLSHVAVLVGVLGLGTSGAAQAGTITYASVDVPKVIPDNDTTGIVSELIVTDHFIITDLDLIFDELLHESVSDLHIELTSAAGTTVVLVYSATEGGILTGLATRDNFINTIFDDQAPINLRDAFFDNHVGTYNIDHSSIGTSPLALFNGENALGTWYLHISDRAFRDTGVLNAWSLRFGFSAVPEPSSLVLMSLGLGVALLFVRNRPRA